MADHSRVLLARIERTTNPDKVRVLSCELIRQLINRIEALEELERESARERDENR